MKNLVLVGLLGVVGCASSHCPGSLDEVNGMCSCPAGFEPNSELRRCIAPDGSFIPWPDGVDVYVPDAGPHDAAMPEDAPFLSGDVSLDSGDDVGTDAGDDAGMDAGDDAAVDAGSDAGDDAGIYLPTACDFPAPHGTEVGETLAPILSTGMDDGDLASCMGPTFSFPDAATCAARYTVLFFWETSDFPSTRQAVRVQSQLLDVYEATDVHVQAFLFDDVDGGPVTHSFCAPWAERNGLPMNTLGLFGPTDVEVFPTQIVVDQTGTIVARMEGPTGAGEGDLNALRAVLDGLLE